MGIFDTPASIRKRAGKSWLFIAYVYALALAGPGFWLYRDLMPHSWVVPPQDELHVATGSFSLARGGRGVAVIFRTIDGQGTSLACRPDSYSHGCPPETMRLLAGIAGDHVKIGYFHSFNSRNMSLSNVLMTISVPEGDLMSYIGSEIRMREWAVTEERIKHTPLTIFFDLLPLGIFVGLATWLTATKIRYNRRGYYFQT